MTDTSDDYLSAARVRSVYERCFRPEGHQPQHNVTVTGWLVRHTFSIRMLQKSREEIIRMLLSLPEGFRADIGRGGSVGLMVQRGNQTFWTGDMTDIEKLLGLGLASGLLNFCADRENWHKLPGGLPYVRIEITRFGVSVN
jgi:hypothetical protein